MVQLGNIGETFFLLYCSYNIVEQCFRLLPYQYCTSSAITTFQHRLLFRLVL
jgi:hypothetical protein